MRRGIDHSQFFIRALPGFLFVFGHVLKIEFVEVREPAVPAPDGEVPGTDNDVMRTGDMTVAARGVLFQFPDRVLPDFRQGTRHIHILDAGDENPGCTAVVAGHLCLVRNSPDDLVRDLLTMIAVRAELCEDEPVAHERY